MLAWSVLGLCASSLWLPTATCSEVDATCALQVQRAKATTAEPTAPTCWDSLQSTLPRTDQDASDFDPGTVQAINLTRLTMPECFDACSFSPRCASAYWFGGSWLGFCYRRSCCQQDVDPNIGPLEPYTSGNSADPGTYRGSAWIALYWKDYCPQVQTTTTSTSTSLTTSPITTTTSTTTTTTSSSTSLTTSPSTTTTSTTTTSISSTPTTPTSTTTCGYDSEPSCRGAINWYKDNYELNESAALHKVVHEGDNFSSPGGGPDEYCGHDGCCGCPGKCNKCWMEVVTPGTCAYLDLEPYCAGAIAWYKDNYGLNESAALHKVVHEGDNFSSPGGGPDEYCGHDGCCGCPGKCNKCWMEVVDPGTCAYLDSQPRCEVAIAWYKDNYGLNESAALQSVLWEGDRYLSPGGGGPDEYCGYDGCCGCPGKCNKCWMEAPLHGAVQ
eukprot:TRINITY_DN5497_c0_g1_i1.p1 TRINITY_DN5497_c0_g1~~TRINITY_DN5497_c0_g1_i1.p1  ORF type:complete len:441 (-),score=40.39 TRINITY_DN5497_c0_g1_i1:136-1458(-)